MNTIKDEKETFLFYLTGFGPFGEIKINPTMVLMQELLPNVITSLEEKLNIKIDCQVIECSAVGAYNAVSTTYKKTIYDTTIKNDKKHIFYLHFGVNNLINIFNLEYQAYNEVYFKIPDVLGYQPQHEQISSLLPIDSTLVTDIPVDKLVTQLKNLDYQVARSNSAGRYVCNWTYFHSLSHASYIIHPNSHALFIHVPEFKNQKKEIHLNFTQDLLHLIVQHYRK